MIAAATFLLTLAGGGAAWLIDREDFDGLGDALWWAVQTVTTVGYGDVVPENVIGRLIGVALMLQGIALLTVITAAVTATLIEQARQRLQKEPDDVLTKLEQVDARLASIRGEHEGVTPGTLGGRFVPDAAKPGVSGGRIGRHRVARRHPVALAVRVVAEIRSPRASCCSCGVNQSAHHSQTLPVMLWSPKPFGGNALTGQVP